jgi:type II secretion system protein J
MRPGATNLRRPPAFTLVEILVAIATLGVVLAAIYSSWTAILRASKVGLEAAAQVQRERIASRTVEEALGTTRSFAADSRHYAFLAENGEDAKLSFVAHLPQSFPRGGRFGDFCVRRVEFSLESAPNWGRQLVLRQTPILMDMDEDEHQHPIVLARDVKKFAFEFWDRQKGDWVDDWLQTNQLPQLVRFTLVFGSSDPTKSRIESQITRVTALPSIMVPANVQVSGPPF